MSTTDWFILTNLRTSNILDADQPLVAWTRFNTDTGTQVTSLANTLDTVDTSVALSADQSNQASKPSQYLLGDFPADIMTLIDGSSIVGLEVEMVRRKSGSPILSSTADPIILNAARLLVDGTAVGVNRADTASWPNVEETIVLGSLTDGWGTEVVVEAKPISIGLNVKSTAPVVGQALYATINRVRVRLVFESMLLVF